MTFLPFGHDGDNTKPQHLPLGFLPVDHTSRAPATMTEQTKHFLAGGITATFSGWLWAQSAGQQQLQVPQSSKQLADKKRC